jgi:hypothetical protein
MSEGLMNIEAPEEKTEGEDTPMLEGVKKAEPMAARPEGVPEDLWNLETGTYNADKLWESFQKSDKIAKDLRTKLAKGEQNVPQKAEDYKIKFDEEISKLVPEDDKGLMLAKQVAFEAGLSQDKFDAFVGNFLAKAKEGGMLDSPEAAAPTEEDIKAHQTAEISKLGKDGELEIKANTDWVVAQYKQGLFSKEDIASISGMVQTAEQVRTFTKLREMLGEQRIPTSTTINSAAPSKLEIQSWVNDPRYDSDPAYRQDVERRVAKAIGEAA